MCSKIGGGCVLSLLLDTNGVGGGTLQRVKINLGGSLGLVLEVCTILNGAPFGQNFIYYGAPFQAEMRTQGCVITWQLCSVLIADSQCQLRTGRAHAHLNYSPY